MPGGSLARRKGRADNEEMTEESTHHVEAQLWVDGMWRGLQELTASPYTEAASRPEKFGPVEGPALPEVRRRVSSFLAEHPHEPVLVTTDRDMEYLFGPGQVGPFRFVFWE
ncbi:hypothetical protein GCM10009540_92850 [Streptomyces turgidiscabies]